MDTFDAIRTRRSVKNYDKNHIMSKKEINQLLETAILSPTSYNIQNWRFVTITDQKIKDNLCTLSYGQKQVADASLVIILCADLNSWNKHPEKYWINAPEDMRKTLLTGIKNSYYNNS